MALPRPQAVQEESLGPKECQPTSVLVEEQRTEPLPPCVVIVRPTNKELADKHKTWPSSAAPSDDAGRPREIHGTELNDGRKGGLEPPPAFHHRSEMFGAHLSDHRPLGQGHKTNGQSARVPVVVLPNATAQQIFEAFEGEVGVVNKDDQVVMEPSGGAAGVDVVVGRHVLLVANQIQVVRVEDVLTPVDVAGLDLAAQGAVSGLYGVVGNADFEAIHVSDFLAMSE